MKPEYGGMSPKAMQEMMDKNKKPAQQPEKEVEEPVDKTASIENLAARVFAARNISHREHWETKSIARHEALEAFYDAIIPAIDEIIEVHQGMYGLIGDFEVEDQQGVEIVAFIKSEAEWIESNRDKFSKCSAVLALIDDLTAIYARTAYKLAQLL